MLLYFYFFTHILICPQSSTTLKKTKENETFLKLNEFQKLRCSISNNYNTKNSMN